MSLLNMKHADKIASIKNRIESLKRQRATALSFGKQRSRDKNGMTKADREDFKLWKKMKEDGKL